MSAENWILLRGLTRESAHWGSFVKELSVAMAPAQVHCLDLPGNGSAHGQTSPSRIADLVTYCQNEMKRRGVPAPYHLLAMSLGAMVATEWAYRAPTELAACVLINTSLRPFSPFYRRLQPHNYPVLLRLLLTGASALEWERAILNMTSKRAPERQAVLPVWVAARQTHPVSHANALRQLLAAARYRAQHTAPATPLLLLASEHDQLAHVSCSHRLARAWGCPLAIHPRAGHDLPLDEPQWVLERVQAWLQAGLPHAP